MNVLHYTCKVATIKTNFTWLASQTAQTTLHGNNRASIEHESKQRGLEQQEIQIVNYTDVHYNYKIIAEDAAI